MLGPHPESHDPPREPARERRTRDEPEREGRRELPGGVQDAGDDSVLDQELEPLGDTRRQLAAPLDPAQVIDVEPAVA